MSNSRIIHWGLLVLTLTASQAWSETPVYRIEALIFTQGQPSTGKEQWPQDISPRYPRNLTALLDPPHQQPATETDVDAVMEGYPVLPASSLTLVDAAAQIKRVRQGQILFHKAWCQPASNSAPSTYVLITGGQEHNGHHELEGSLALSEEKALHLKTNLWLNRFVINTGGQNRPEWPILPDVPDLMAGSEKDSAPTTTGITVRSVPYGVDRSVTLKTDRRIIAGETHYIDHPLFGLIVRVEPCSDTATPTGSTMD